MSSGAPVSSRSGQSGRHSSNPSRRAPSVPPRPSTSASVRPSLSVPSVRPATSLDVRPPSSAWSVRSSSSGLAARPPTSASIRSGSRATSSLRIRRPDTRQSARLMPYYQSLVTQLTGISAEEDEEHFQSTVDYVARNLDPTVKPAGSSDITAIDRQIRGLSQKARIMNRDEYAEALSSAYSKLKKCVEEQTSDLDAEINTSRIPNHLQFLLALSQPPDPSTLIYADNYLELRRNPPKPKTGLTWKDILAEEPFEGQHWQGAYGLPPGSTVENWEAEDSDSSLLSLSALDDLDNLDDGTSSSDSEVKQKEGTPPSSPHTYERKERQYQPNWDHREIVEALQARQYWRPEWRLDVDTNRPFDFGDPSTLGPAFHRALSAQAGYGVEQLAQMKYIEDDNAVREILMGLQGRRNLMISWVNTGTESNTFQPATDAPRLLHLTAGTLDSMLACFARVATTVEHLRKFVCAIFAKASQSESLRRESSTYSLFHRRSTRTLEALSESIDTQIRSFDSWCAAKEEAICKAQGGVGPPLVISMLALEIEIRDKFSSIFTVLVHMLQQVVQRATRSTDPIKEIWTLPDLPQRISPSALTALLLDSLLLAVQEHSTMGDSVATQALLRIFCDTAEPIWAMVGRWLRDGMPIREVIGPADQYLQTVDEEFFIEDNELVLLDPDFWSDGFMLRNGQEDGRATAVPLFLSHAAEHILGAGKAIGLLRALGMSSVFEREGKERWLSEWPQFKALLGYGPNRSTDVETNGDLKVHVSADDLSRLVYDEMLSPCQLARQMLSKVVVEDCELWLHLIAMEDLYLMRKGDVMSNFIDVVFARMDANQAWHDFHFLNSAFRDVVEAGGSRFIDPSLVRFSYRGSKDRLQISHTVRAIEGLAVEYAVPFPLTYIFGPRVLQVYSSIFALILQIRRAQNALERILVRNSLVNMTHLGSELKVFYAMRGKLSWFVNALLNFTCTNVLHTQIISLHTALLKANSLEEMVALHHNHLTKLEGGCLLKQNTAGLHRAIISVLDMSLHFSECFVAFAGDTTHDISHQSLLHAGRHRSRRLKRQRKNVIGFSQSVRQIEESSDSSSDEEPALGGSGPDLSFSFATSTVSFEDEGFDVRVEKMSKELDTLVRFIRRGVEGLAGGTSEAASAFGVFAFALEDWDR